jgi:hypothetical protein
MYLHVEELHASGVALCELHGEAHRDLVDGQVARVGVALRKERPQHLHAQDHAFDDVVDGGEHVQARAGDLAELHALRVRVDGLDEEFEPRSLHKGTRRRGGEEGAAADGELRADVLVCAVRLETGEHELHAVLVHQHLAQKGLRLDDCDEGTPRRQLHLRSEREREAAEAVP